jgi:hypothetical protein
MPSSVAWLLLALLTQSTPSDPVAPTKRPAFGWVRDDARQPVAGARIEVLATSDASSPVAVAFSEESGRFEFPGLPSGRYVLRLMAPGYARLTEPLEIPLGTAAVKLGRFRLERRVMLKGRVLEVGGYPVWGAEIYLAPRGSGAGRRRPPRIAAMSSHSGEFRIPDLDPSVGLSVTVCKQGYRATAVTVPDPTALTEISLTRGAQFRGRAIGPDWKPIHGARIAFDPRAAGSPCDKPLTTFTDVRGEFELVSLSPGTYDVFAAAEGYTSARLKNVQVSLDGFNLTMFLATVLRVTVASEDGRRVTGAEIQVLGANAQPKARSDLGGGYILLGANRGPSASGSPILRTSIPPNTPCASGARAARTSSS